MKNNKVFVTGGTGFVGSHLVKALIDRGDEVVVGVRSRDPKSLFSMSKLEEQVILADYDLKDFNRVFDILSKYEINVVMHLGAQPIVSTAYKNPYETLSSNIIGTMNILEASRLCGNLEAIIVASSDKAYGISDVLPYTEEMKLDGQHPYDCSKSSTDLIAKMYAKTYGLPVTISRCGNIFGPGDLNFNRIIPGIMKALTVDEELLLRSDGEMVREYLYVKDIVEGYLLLADNIDKTRGEAFNFGTSRQYSVLEIIALCEESLGVKVKYKILDNAKGEIPIQYLDNNKLKQLLGWECNYDMKKAIKETFEWYRKCLR